MCCVVTCAVPLVRLASLPLRSAEELADPKLFANNVRTYMAKVRAAGTAPPPALSSLKAAEQAQLLQTCALRCLEGLGSAGRRAGSGKAGE